jgi:hypothetical protein
VRSNTSFERTRSTSSAKLIRRRARRSTQPLGVMRVSLPEHLVSASASEHELVLPFAASLEALNAIAANGGRILGWEGWLRRSDGSLGHSAIHQGTLDLTGTAPDEALELCRETMAEANREHSRAPEIGGSELLFCITYDA